MRKRFSEAQIHAFLRAVAAGTPVIDVCWNHCISRSTFYGWKARHGAAIDAEIRRLKALERENARLREALVRALQESESPGHCFSNSTKMTVGTRAPW
jgi:putative transposase